MRKSSLISLIIIAFLLIIMGSCSSDVTEESADQPTKVGGMTECTVDAVQPFVTAYVQLSGSKNQMPIDDLQCAKGWAVASGILGPEDAPATGPQGAPTSLVLEAEGQFWIIKDKSKVCGTYDSTKPEEYPTDAEVPSALYMAGCLAG